VLLLVLLAAATVITLGYKDPTKKVVDALKRGANDVVAPLDSGVSSALRPVGNFIEGVIHYGSLQSQNAQLLAENTRLRTAALQAQDQARQVAQLKRQLGLGGTIPRVAADVVGASTSNFAQTVRIDRGLSSGVAVGMTVVSGDALVGQVVQAWRSGASVLLITDPSSNVGVRLGQAGGAYGVAVGQGAGEPLAVTMVSPNAKVSRGQPVDTSGLPNAAFPPDVLVGTVRSARLSPTSSQWSVTVDPVADLGRLQYVTVLEWSPQG